MTTSEAIFKWLDENKELVKVSVVCSKAGIDKGNLAKYREKGAIPEKYLIPIMDVITPLGFNLDELVASNKKPEPKKKVVAKKIMPQKPSPQIKDLNKPTGVVKAPEQPKTNYSVDTTGKKQMPAGLSKADQFKWMKDNK